MAQPIRNAHDFEVLCKELINVLEGHTIFDGITVLGYIMSNLMLEVDRDDREAVLRDWINNVIEAVAKDDAGR